MNDTGEGEPHSPSVSTPLRWDEEKLYFVRIKWDEQVLSVLIIVSQPLAKIMFAFFTQSLGTMCNVNASISRPTSLSEVHQYSILWMKNPEAYKKPWHVAVYGSLPLLRSPPSVSPSWVSLNLIAVIRLSKRERHQFILGGVWLEVEDIGTKL